MNSKNIQFMIDFFRELPDERFDYRYFLSDNCLFSEPSQLFHNCNTAGCLGGWIAAFCEKEKSLVFTFNIINYPATVARFFDIDIETASSLTLNNHNFASKIKRHHIIARLEHLLANENLTEYDFPSELLPPPGPQIKKDTEFRTFSAPKSLVLR